MQQQSAKADDASLPVTSGPGQTETQPNGPQMSGGAGGPGGVGGMGGADSAHPPHMPPRPGSGPGPGQGPPQAGMPIGPPMGMPPYRGMMPHYVSTLLSSCPPQQLDEFYKAVLRRLSNLKLKKTKKHFLWGYMQKKESSSDVPFGCLLY